MDIWMKWMLFAWGALAVGNVALWIAWVQERKSAAYFERLAADADIELRKAENERFEAKKLAVERGKIIDGFDVRLSRVRSFVNSRNVTVSNKKTGRFGPFDQKELDSVMDGQEIP